MDKNDPECVSSCVAKYLIGGFTLIPALAWNDLIKKFFEKIAPVPSSEEILFRIIYVIVISILAWICVRLISKAFT